jgi:hypothetical protein
MNAATSIKKGETRAAPISVFQIVQIQEGVSMGLPNKISIKKRMMIEYKTLS